MRYRRTRDIIIELTSLLDIVMILIFAVMVINTKLLVETQKNLEMTTAELVETQERNTAMQEELESTSEDLKTALEKLDESGIEELLEQIQNAENQLDAYNYMDDIVVVFNVELENNYNNTERYLTYGDASDKNKWKQFCIKRKDVEEWDKAISTLKVDLQEFLKNETTGNSEDKYIYIIFSVDETKVYADDHKIIQEVLEETESKSDNEKIRYKLNKIKSEE